MNEREINGSWGRKGVCSRVDECMLWKELVRMDVNVWTLVNEFETMEEGEGDKVIGNDGC